MPFWRDLRQYSIASFSESKVQNRAKSEKSEVESTCFSTFLTDSDDDHCFSGPNWKRNQYYWVITISCSKVCGSNPVHHVSKHSNEDLRSGRERGGRPFAPAHGRWRKTLRLLGREYCAAAIVLADDSGWQAVLCGRGVMKRGNGIES